MEQKKVLFKGVGTVVIVLIMVFSFLVIKKSSDWGESKRAVQSEQEWKKEKSDTEKREIANKMRPYFTTTATDSLFLVWGSALQISQKQWNYATKTTNEYVADPQYNLFDPLTVFCGMLQRVSPLLDTTVWMQELVKHFFLLREEQYKKTQYFLLLKE